MGDLFMILAIACMSLYLWGQLSGSQQNSLKASGKKLRDSVKETIHNNTK